LGRTLREGEREIDGESKREREVYMKRVREREREE
jgi:hypothetical protein